MKQAERKPSSFAGQDLEAGSKDEKSSLLGKTPRGIGGVLSGALPAMKNDPPIIAYDPEQLTNWRAIISLNGTIFLQPAVIFIIVSQFTLAALVALLIAFFAKQPKAYDSNAMDGLVKTVAVSIAFLLGMFLSSCINRWWDTIKSLESLFGTIKRLTMTSINLEVPHDARVLIMQRCVLSARCLQVELVENHAMLSGQLTKEEMEQHWAEYFETWVQQGRISRADAQVLHRVPPQQRSFFAWSLVSQELIHVRSSLVQKDGHADVMAYDRLCDLVQDGVASVSNVRTAAAFQMPYVYVHMLAFMIHFVNVLTAIGTGIRVGLLAATARTSPSKTIDANSIGSALIFLFVQAFIYQAFLTIGAALSFPITGSAYRIPLLAMVDALEKQVHLMNTLADDAGKAEKDIDLTQYQQTGGDDEAFFD